MSEPILYSFRRCPFAIRARLAIYFAGIRVELREVVLRDKPQAMLDASPKGTVPVLLVGDRVVDESIDIMKWTLEQNSWCQSEINFALVRQNDVEFKPLLDRYKYFDRHPEKSREEHREAALPYLRGLDQRLKAEPFLAGEERGFEDVAVFPFVRQFANSDRAWFDGCEFDALLEWLANWEQSDAFAGVMQKFAKWESGHPPALFPDRSS